MAERRDEDLQRLAGFLATGGQPHTGKPVDDELLAAFMDGELAPGTPPHDQVLAALAADPALRERWLGASRLEAALRRDEDLEQLAGLLATAGAQRPTVAIEDELLSAFIDGELEPGTPPHDQVLAALAADPVLRRRWLEASRLHSALRRDEDLERLAGLLATAGPAPAADAIDDTELAAFMDGGLEPGTSAHDQVLAALAADPVLRRRWLEAARLSADLSAVTVEAAPAESARVLPFQPQRKAAGGGGSGSKRGRWLSGLTALAASLFVATIVVRPWMAGPEGPGAPEDNWVRSGVDGGPPAIPYGDALVALAGQGVQALERDAQWDGSQGGPRSLTGLGKAAWIDRFGSADPAAAPSTLAAGYAIGIERVASALAETDPAWTVLAERARRRAGQGCRDAQACEAAAGLGAWALATAIQCRAGLVPGGSEELTALPALLIDGVPKPWPAEWPVPPLSADRLCPEAGRVASLARLEQ